MGTRNKQIANGRGTDLTIGTGAYISVGQRGSNVTIRCSGKVLAFDTWEDLVAAIDASKAVYHSEDIMN